MTGHVAIKGAGTKVDLGAWFYLGGQTLTMDGTTQTLTLPGSCSIVEIDAESGPIYYQINGNASSTNANGFVPTNGGRILGPLANQDFTMTVWGDAQGAVAHIQYFRAA